MHIIHSLFFSLLYLVICFFVTSCHTTPHYPKDLLEVDSLAMNRPDSALVILQSLEPKMQHASLPVRNYYQLLKVKAQDKAFIPHTSDSLILSLLCYYAEEGDPRLLPEACYYAGRVTRDLGDSPQALDYFHQALDAFERPAYQQSMKGKEHATLYLKGKIYAQMGYLFRRQHLYDEAINSIIQTYRIDSINGDTVGMIIDYKDIGNVYYVCGKFNDALANYHLSEGLAKAIKDTFQLFKTSCQLAALYNETGEYGKAREYIKKYPATISRSNWSSYYSIMAGIYSNSKEFDIAERYYKDLLNSNDVYARSSANLWLGKRYIDKRDPRSFDYLNTFMLLEDSLRSISNEEAIALSHSLYNYQLREKEVSSLKIREAKLTAKLWMITAFAAIIILLLYIEHVRRRKIKDRYEHLQTILAANKQYARLKQELSLAKNKDLKNNETYKYVKQKCEKNRVLTKSDWNEIEALFESVIPEFLPNLQRIQHFNDTEWKLTLLLRMGFSLPEIATLISLSYEAVHSSQARLYKKVFRTDAIYKNWKEFVLSL